MRLSHPATLLAFLAVAAAPAMAADLPRRSGPPPEDYYSPAPVSNWQGLYVGINGGLGFASFGAGSDTLIGNANGGLIGGTVGFNFVPAPNLVVGVEGDFDFAGIKASGMPYPGVYRDGSANDIFTVRARVGYTFNRALIYLTGGFAGSNNSVSVSNVWTRFAGQQSTYQTGWALGAGVEYMLTSNLSAKAEYIFTSVGSSHDFFNFSFASLQTNVDNSMVRLGVNYHF